MENFAIQENIPRDILHEIVNILNDRPSTLVNVLWFLHENTNRVSRYIALLTSAHVSNNVAFQELVERLGEDIDELNRNPNYNNVMDDMWLNNNLRHDATNFVSGQRLDFQLNSEKKKRFEIIAICLGISIMLRLDVLTPETLQKLIPLYNNTLPINILSIKELLNMAQKLSGERYEVSASFGYFIYDFFRNWKRHENREISGVRCIKNIADSFTELGPGVAGGFGGELFGSSIAPGIGTLVGGVGGGMTSAFLSGALSDRITQWIFNIPKDEALENAFRELSLPCNASNNEINISFIRLAHQNPPYPLNPNPNWVKLKESINTIKEVRE